MIMLKPDNYLKIILQVILYLASATAFADGSGGINLPEQRNKPYLILVSIDGFRWDYQNRYNTPALDRLAANGVRAERMVPVFPTLTFPNHYTIATGLYPKNHRLIGNTFPNKDQTKWYRMQDREAVQNGEWYSGVPVWVAAEKAGMVTAAYYYVGTEAKIQNIEMTYWNEYDASVPGIKRVTQVLDWLAMPVDKRPHFITLYFEDVDTAAHRFGPDSTQTVAAIEQVDGYLDTLFRGLEKMSIADQLYIVVLSDHGLLQVLPDTAPFIIDEHISLDGLAVIDHGSAAHIYFPTPDPQRLVKIRDAINSVWKHGKALLRNETPARWHVTAAAGFAELIVQADPGYIVSSTADRFPSNLKGHHGWDQEVDSMHATFIASGPRLPSGIQIEAINATDVYPLMMEVLGLQITSPIDGDPAKLLQLLK